MRDFNSKKLYKKPELLAPAGDYECFLAAVLAGCDAVYLSGEKYGARAYAKNFSMDEIINAIETAHLYNVKVYLTVNTLFKNDELDGLHNYIQPLYEAGLDSVIVQDAGVISYIHEHFPDLNIHASTQLAITSSEGVKLLHKLNVKRCVLARELSYDEIKRIHDDDDMELECFIHGALCYSYSGKCLLSSMIGGRSGNRGRCAGTCRQPYNGKYLLSTKDICCLEILPDLMFSGITSFKIEGRMKSAEYVYGVTSIYRKYIDLIADSYDFSNPCDGSIMSSYKDFYKDLNILERLYTRGGNSKGYYFKNNGRDMISLDDASYRRDTGNDKNAVSYSLEKIKITGKITIKTGEAINLSLSCGKFSVKLSGGTVIKAQKTPADENTVKKHLYKTGDTVFEFDGLMCDISKDAFVRVADLNNIRRDALNKLKNKMLDNTRRYALSDSNEHIGLNTVSCIKDTARIADKPHNNNTAGITDTMQINNASDDFKFTADICTKEQLAACILNPKISRIYIPFSLWHDDNTEILSAGQNGKEVYIKFQSVIRHGFIEKNAADILQAADSSDGVLIDNNELLYFFSENNYKKPVAGDIHMYCLNNMAYDTYSFLGMTRFTYPIELNRRELLKLGRTGDELIIYGYLPLMISAQCVNNTEKVCDYLYKHIKLKDRKGADFTCANDCKSCTNIIYNSVPLSLHDDKPLFSDLKPESLKICLTIEDREASVQILDYFTDRCSFSKNTEIKPPYAHFTKGHMNRGVL